MNNKDHKHSLSLVQMYIQHMVSLLFSFKVIFLFCRGLQVTTVSFVFSKYVLVF